MYAGFSYQLNCDKTQQHTICRPCAMYMVQQQKSFAFMSSINLLRDGLCALVTQALFLVKELTFLVQGQTKV